MKFLKLLKNTTLHAFIICIVIIIAGASFATDSAQAANISLGGPRDCNSNAVMYCGAGSVNTVQSKYHNGVSGHNTASSIQHIYNYFGISSGDINSMDSYTVAGNVYKDGNVKVNGKIVATHAWTAGRQNIAGSTKITYAGTTFYKRQPSVSFVSNPLAAYVVMKNGVFQFAILASCGNPVSARPVIPTPTHKPTPTPTQIPHHYACVSNACAKVVGAGNNTCTSNTSCQPAAPHHYACVNYACV